MTQNALTIRRSALSPLLGISLWISCASLLLAVEVPFDAATVIDSDFDNAEVVLLVDLDGDGDLDAVAGGSGEIAVRIAEEDGTWTKVSIDNTVVTPTSIIAEDFDGDGDFDLAATDSEADTLIWYENVLADASSWTRTEITTTESGVASVVAADLDGDGDLDLLTAAFEAHRVAWWAYEAGGFTSTPTVVASSFTGAGSVAAHDLDRDGDPDVVATASTGGKLSLFENTNAGSSWTEESIDATLNDPAFVAVNDFNADNAPDIAVAARGDNKIYVYEQQADASWSRLEAASVDEPYSLRSADLDSDGDPDLAGSAIDADLLFYLENTNSGWTLHPVASAVGGIRKATTGDLDGDGDPDLVAALATSGDVSAWTNLHPHRSAYFAAPVQVEHNFSAVSYASAADMDGDGDQDLVATSPNADRVRWWRNPGDGSADWPHINVGTLDRAYGVDTADMDGDGDPDVIAASLSVGVRWWENDDQGDSFTSHTVVSVAGNYYVHATDLDRDGDTDLVVLDRTADTVRWQRNDDGIGQTWTSLEIATALDAHFADPADMDGDGDVDLLVTGPIANAVILLENIDGDGITWTSSVVGALDGSFWVGAADFDRDGTLEVAATSQSSGARSWKYDGAAWVESIVDASGVLYRGDTADLDGDGDHEIVVSALSEDKIYRYERADDGTWSREEFEETFDGPVNVEIFDVDGDTRLDIVATYALADDLQLWRNVGGQIALPTTDVAPAIAFGGSVEPVLRIVARHNGKAADPSAVLRDLTLQVTDASGTPLTSSQAAALLIELELYKDDPLGTVPGDWDATDTLLASETTFDLDADGRLIFPFVDDDPALVIDPDSSQTFFFVAELHPDGAAQIPNTLRISHGSSFPANAEIFQGEIPLSLELRPDVAATTLLDIDTDHDLIFDSIDNCPLDANPGQEDEDLDDVGTVCDNCATVANTDQSNLDSDAFGDDCDNCVLVDNPDQADVDDDLLGDVCDPCNLGGPTDVVPLELAWNWNGIAHAGEEGSPDAASGFRALGALSLEQGQGRLDDLTSSATGIDYQFRQGSHQVDSVFLVVRTFDDDPDGDATGIQPDWLDSPIQTVIEGALLPVKTLTSTSTIGVLYHSDGRDFDYRFRLRLQFADGTSVEVEPENPGNLGTGNVSAPEEGISRQHRLGRFQGFLGADDARFGVALSLYEALITGPRLLEDLNFDIDGKILDSVKFSYGNGRTGIYAMTVDGTPLTQLPWNWNGFVDDEESASPDLIDGYRSYGEEGLSRSDDGIFRRPTSSSSGITYETVTEAGVLDMIHLGNRDALYAFDDTSDGDERGTQPDWLPDPDQSAVFSSVSPNIELTLDTSLGLLYHGSAAGTFEVTLHFADDSTSPPITLATGDWDATSGESPPAPSPGVSLQENLGSFAARSNYDLADVDDPVYVHEALISARLVLRELGVDLGGRTLTGITFDNRSNSAGYGIYALSLLGSFDLDGDGNGGACNLCEGDDATGDADADGRCADSDCNDQDPTVQDPNACGICSATAPCPVFEDGFESGDTSTWSAEI